MNKRQILQTLKGRIDIYILLAFVAGSVIFNAWNIEDRLGTEIRLTQKDVQSMKEAQAKDDAADAELLEAKFGPVIEGNKRLQREVDIVQAEIRGLTVAATDGADARHRLLEGSLRILQEKVINVQDSLLCIQHTVRILEDLAHVPPDTIVRVKIDTLTVEEDGNWWNPFD